MNRLVPLAYYANWRRVTARNARDQVLSSRSMPRKLSQNLFVVNMKKNVLNTRFLINSAGYHFVLLYRMEFALITTFHVITR